MKLIERFIIIVIYFYQNSLSLFLGPCCRFYPSCSNYAIESITRYGLGKGARMALKRIFKCHPFHPGGYDPVQDNI